MLLCAAFRWGRRPLLIARLAGRGGATLRRSGAFASIVVERIVDGLAIGVLGILALRMLGETPWTLRDSPARSVLVALGSSPLLAVTAAFFLREPRVQLTSALLRPVSRGWAAGSSMSTRSSPPPRRLGMEALAFFALTALYWSLNGFGLAILPGFASISPADGRDIVAVQVVA